MNQNAKRIVTIQSLLQKSMDPNIRARLIAEQRLLWDAQFPGRGFEEVARAAA